MNQSDVSRDAVHPLEYDSSQRPTRVRYKVLAFLCVLAFLTYFDRVCIMRAQVDIQRDLKIDDDQMGWIMGIFWFAYALFEIPSGWVGDRYGARGTLTRVVLAWSFFTALSGSAMGFISLFTYRFMFGAGEAGAFPNMARIQGAWLPPKARARAGGLLWLCARWGGAFSPILFGKLIQLFTSDFFGHATAGTALHGVSAWRFGFYTSGILGLVWVAAFWLWFRDNPADKKSVNALARRKKYSNLEECVGRARVFRCGANMPTRTEYAITKITLHTAREGMAPKHPTIDGRNSHPSAFPSSRSQYRACSALPNPVRAGSPFSQPPSLSSTSVG